MDEMHEEDQPTIKFEVNGDVLESNSGPSDGTSSVHNLDEAPTIVQLTIPAEVQSVIQPNQQSVIQSANLAKSNVILVSSKSNSVIQTPQGSIQAVQVDYVVGSSDDDSMSDELEDGVTKKRREILTRRPSYRKILNDLGGGEIAVIPASAIQLSNQSEGGIHTLNLNSSGGNPTIVQYQSGDGGQFFVPGSPGEYPDQSRKREMRLMKNREAARECRRKKKEYIKCLENRVAVLENQNKALIDELKTLKELYCQQKIE